VSGSCAGGSVGRRTPFVAKGFDVIATDRSESAEERLLFIYECKQPR
jgi:hypothetical protein